MTYQEIINYAKSLNIDEIEIYASKQANNTLKIFNGKLESYNAKDLFSVSLRGKVNGKMGYASTESLDESSIKIALNKLIESSSLITSLEEDEIFGEKIAYMTVENAESDADQYSLAEKQELLKELEQKTLAYDSRIKKVGYCQYTEAKGNVTIVNSKGVNLNRDFSYLVLFCGAYAEENGETSVGYAQKIGFNFKSLNVCELAEKAGKKAVSGLNAGFVKSGAYPVVFDKEVATDLLQAFVGIFSGQSAMKKMTLLEGKVGTKVFGDNITIIDDPFCEQALIKVPFDDEAYPCSKKAIVENGVFNGFLHSLKTAKFFNTKSTGNGFKAGNQVVPSPINLYLKPGNCSKDEVLAGIQEGIYITELQGLHAGLNVVAGTFNLQSSGFMIRNGELKEAVTLFVVSGNFFEMMNNVEKIANDLDEEFTDVACPTIKVNGLMISGK